jgi:hypothetical protein
MSREVSYIVKKGTNALPLTCAVPGGTMRVWWQSMRALHGGAEPGIAWR